MNYKIRFLVALLIISVFLLSGCEVYQTLYGPAKKVEIKEAGKVVRLEGENAKDPANLAKTVYAAVVPVSHDIFKVGPNPLGPFDKGKSLGFTLGQWLAAGGIGIYSVDNDAQLELSFKNLVPNGVYTVWCSRLTFPPEPNIVDKPCGAEDGSQNSFASDEKGAGSFSLKLMPLEASTEETASVIALAYHSDGKTYGASPGDFGLNSHVQLFFMLPVPTGNATKFEVPIKFVNHLDAGFPEQDVFVESEEMTKPEVTGEAIKEEIKKEEAKPEVKSAEMPKEKPIVVVVQETELVDLVPNAEDPDKSTSLVFTFTSPLSDKGQWQTTYGDAGEYTITVTVSDGELTTSRDVLLIINKKEEAPAIDSSKPIESALTIDETQAIDFSVQATDLNKDSLTYTWKLDGNVVGSDAKYLFQTDYDSAGTHTIKADISDDTSTVSKIWSVNVGNVNRAPVLEKINDIKAEETDEIIITALATDSDNDPITYSISDSRFAQDNNLFSWQTDYDSAGSYEVTVAASDGKDSTSQTITVNVENVNRPPLITDIVQKK